MAEHTPKYVNNILLGPVTCVWPHVFQPRAFQGKGDPKFDIGVVISPEKVQEISPHIQQLAIDAFPAGEHQLPNFLWPAVSVTQKLKSPKLAEVYPGHFILSAKSFPDNPPQILIPNSPGQQPAYVPMPEAQRSQLVYDGALCYITLDFASFYTGSNFGIRAQFSSVVFWGAGEHVTIGTRPDAVDTLTQAGLNLQMQAPTPLQNQVAPTQQPMPGQPVQQPVPQGMPNQPMPGAAPTQPAAQQAAPANPFAPPVQFDN